MRLDPTQPQWPLDENGQQIPPAYLTQTTKAQETIELRMTLLALGIPFIVKNPNGQIYTDVLFGSDFIGGFIYVPETLLEDVKTLLATPADDSELPEELRDAEDDE